MIDTQPPADESVERGADLERIIRVKATPDILFDALTSTTDLAAWWAPVTGSGDAGGTLNVHLGSSSPFVIQVGQTTRPTTVCWTVIDYAAVPGWIGTQPTFTISRVDESTSELRVQHWGLTHEMDCFEQCARSWDRFLPSLRRYVEDGYGNPHDSHQ